MLKRILYIFAPIQKGEWKKFFCMGILFFCVLFNYNVLRAMKDSLLVPNIGAEAISFVKMYVITPAALSFMLLYTYMSNRMSFQRIFVYIAGFFLVFFILFALVLYPYADFFHPNPETIASLSNSEIKFFSYTMHLDHFKWFFKLYGKWTFVAFYVVAELWGSAMIFLLYWQFANKITKTEEAKRLYPMYCFVGHIGSTLGGAVMESMATTTIGSISLFGKSYDGFISLIMFIVSIATICALCFFMYLNYFVVQGQSERKSVKKKPETLKVKLTIAESLKIIFSSRYLGLIVILVFCYGISINLIEGVWKDKARLVYSNTKEYAFFMGNLMKWTGISTLAFTILGGFILRNLGWLMGAILTPIMMLVTGMGFFVFIVFGEFFAGFVSDFGVSVIFVAVLLGAIQNVLTKGTKYSLFDATKEMTYIPASEEIKSKGKAAVDVVGARLAKSGGALVQSLLFMIFPLATFDSLAPYFMVLFVLLIAIWIANIFVLNKSYELRVAKK
jgi:AAA family ATP:ADP antiporter